MYWRHTTTMLLSVSFGTFRRYGSNGLSWMHTTETSWWRTTKTSLSVSFETCLKRRVDMLIGRRCCVLMRCRNYVPIRCRGDVILRPLGNFPSRRRWVFHLRRTCDFGETYRQTLLRRLVAGRVNGWKRN